MSDEEQEPQTAHGVIEHRTSVLKSRLNRLPGLGEWVGTWRPQQTSVPKSNSIGLSTQQGLGLLQLQVHYDFIVYLFYSLWRKTLTMLAPGDCAAVFERERRSGASLDRLSNPSLLGMSGALNRVNLWLPKVFLEERRLISFASLNKLGPKKLVNQPERRLLLSLSSIDSRSGVFAPFEHHSKRTIDFAAFLTSAAQNGQSDVMMIIVENFRLDPKCFGSILEAWSHT